LDPCGFGALLCHGLRVIEARDGLAWIVQRRMPSPKSLSYESRRSPKRPCGRRPESETLPTDDWRGLRWVWTSEELRRCERDHIGEFDPVTADVLAALPERIGGSRKIAQPAEPIASPRPCASRAADIASGRLASPWRHPT
jgi:hypothetical protein